MTLKRLEVRRCVASADAPARFGSELGPELAQRRLLVFKGPASGFAVSASANVTTSEPSHSGSNHMQFSECRTLAPNHLGVTIDSNMTPARPDHVRAAARVSEHLQSAGHVQCGLSAIPGVLPGSSQGVPAPDTDVYSLRCVIAITGSRRLALIELVVVRADVGLVQHAIVITDHLHTRCTPA